MKHIIFSIITLTILAGCGSNAPEQAAQSAAVASENTITLTREQLQKAGIELGQPEQRKIAATLTANGRVAILPDHKATVTARINGMVEQFFVHEGQQVKKGQALMSISASAIFDIQQTYLQAKADLIFLQKELERQKTLSGQQVGATKSYEEVQSKFARANGDLQVAAAKLHYLGIEPASLDRTDHLQLAKTVVVSAPISGNITDISVNLGASVGEGTILCNIVGLDDLHAHIEVFAKDIAFVKEGQEVTIRFPNSAAAAMETKVEYISRDLDPVTKTYSLHIPLAAAKQNNYLPGMPVVAEIKTQGGIPVTALPESALITDGQKVYCFVVDNPGPDKVNFQKLEFEPGLRSGGWMAVPEHLLNGKTVAVRGANLVDGEMRKGEME